MEVALRDERGEMHSNPDYCIILTKEENELYLTVSGECHEEDKIMLMLSGLMKIISDCRIETVVEMTTELIEDFRNRL